MKKLFNYKTLMTVIASIIVLLQVLMTVFKVNLNIDAVVSISIALVGVLVSIGIVKKNKDDKTIKNKEDLTELLDESKENNNETQNACNDKNDKEN